MSRTFNARAALRAVRRYLVVPLVGAGIGITVAQSLTGRIPATYATDASVVITASTVDPTTRAKVADLTLAQGLAPTVAQLVESREVALFTAASLNLPPGAVAGHVKGSYQRGTQVVTVRATAPSATGASTIANAVARATMRQFALLQVGVGGNVAIQLLDQADPPAAPGSPDRRLFDVAGALAGLVVGFGLTWLGGRADDRLRRPARVASELGLPVLGMFPRLPGRYARRNARTLYTRRGVAGAAAATVAALSVLTSPLPRRRVLVTSVRDDDGKGVVSALLALALAEGQDRVTLIEGQPGRPGVGGHFPQATEYAAARALADNGGCLPSLPGAATLSVVAAGQRNPASSGAREVGGGEVGRRGIGASQIGRLIDAAADGGAIAVVNAPPVLAGAGLARLARYADGLVLVVRTGVTLRSEARRAAELIRRLGLPVVGVVAVDATGRALPERYPDLSLPAPAPAVPDVPTASRPAPTPAPSRAPALSPAPAPSRVPALSPAPAPSRVPALSPAPALSPTPSVAAPALPAAEAASPASGRRAGAPAPDATPRRAPVNGTPLAPLPAAPLPAAPLPAAPPPAAAQVAAAPETAASPQAAPETAASPAPRHLRQEAVDALSAPFDLVTESLELAALADEDTVHPLPAAGAGAAGAPRPTGPGSGVNAGPDQPWQLSPGRSVPGSRNAENSQPKEFA